MTRNEVADVLLDALDEMKTIRRRTIHQGASQPLRAYRDQLVGWKANTRQLIRDHLGRDVARTFEDVGDPSVVGPTTELLNGVIASYEHYLTALATSLRETAQSEGDVPGGAPIPTFCSYSSRDDAYRARLQVALAVLEREGLLKMWEFRNLEAGTEWDKVIRKHLHEAKLMLLLVSADFFASRYTVEEELSLALERHAAGSARVVPIIVRPCDWLHTDLRHLQALPRDGKAITKWANVDAAWQDVTDGIRRVVQSMRAAETVAPSSLTQAQKQVLATFMDRGRRVGEGLLPNVFIGDRDAMDAIAQFVEAGALTYGKNNFILLTERGYRLAMELAKAD